MRLASVALALLLPFVGVAAPLAADTAKLTQLLKPLQGRQRLELTAAEFRSVQSAFIAWVDARVRAGRDGPSMNHELDDAQLRPKDEEDHPDDPTEFFERSYVGFLGGVSLLQEKSGLLAIQLTIPTGPFCALDYTLLLYERQPLRRLMSVNADAAYHRYRLTGFAASPRNSSGERTIASSWVISNCTSNWNGTTARIDRWHAGSTENLLSNSLGARNDSIETSIDGDVVTFQYRTHMGDLAFLERPGIARYRIRGREVVREAPIATTVGGFISEWLNVSDSEARRWSEPQASAAHHDAAEFRKKDSLFEFEGLAECTPETWEVTIRWRDSHMPLVFRVYAPRATQLRMQRVSATGTGNCKNLDFESNVSNLAKGLPD